MASTANFDRLARPYRALEYLAFGSALERARFRFLERLRDCRNILVLGEGDGRCLARLLKLAPAARIRCVDSSAAMLARAEARIGRDAARARVTFEQADVLSLQLPREYYDAVTTLFLLDCFRPEQVAALIARTEASLRPGALWLFADFILPPRGWTRWRARLWLALLYGFFRWQTGLPASALPPSEDAIIEAGLSREATQDFQLGLVRSAVFRKP